MDRNGRGAQESPSKSQELRDRFMALGTEALAQADELEELAQRTVQEARDRAAELLQEARDFRAIAKRANLKTGMTGQAAKQTRQTRQTGKPPRLPKLSAPMAIKMADAIREMTEQGAVVTSTTLTRHMGYAHPKQSYEAIRYLRMRGYIRPDGKVKSYPDDPNSRVAAERWVIDDPEAINADRERLEKKEGIHAAA